MTITRTGKALLALPVIALALAACGGSTDSSSDTESESEVTGLLPAAEGQTQYPLTVTTWAGDSVLQERPERVAVLGFSSNLDALEALDVTPVYSVADDDEWAWRDPEWFAGIEFVDTATRSDPFNFEAITAADPDVIVATNVIWDEADFEKLSEIAPVVEFEDQAGDKASWQDAQVLIGEALDLTSAAEEVVAQAEAAIADVAAAHPEFEGRTITVLNDYGPEWGLSYYTPTGSTAEGVMLDLGFTQNPLGENFVDDDVVSDENLAMIDADVLVVIYGDETIRDAREAMPLFQAVPAVAEGSYVSLTYDAETDLVSTPEGESYESITWVLRRGASALSLPWAVDVLANNWLSSVDLGS